MAVRGEGDNRKTFRQLVQTEKAGWNEKHSPMYQDLSTDVWSACNADATGAMEMVGTHRDRVGGRGGGGSNPVTGDVKMGERKKGFPCP